MNPAPFYMASIAAALLIAVTAAVRRRPLWVVDLAIATTFCTFPLWFTEAMQLCEGIRRQTCDTLLYRADASAGLDSFFWIRFTLAHRELYRLLITAYIALPIVLAIAWILERSNVLLCACSIAPSFALVLYVLVPGVGPIHAFSSAGAVLPFDAVSSLPRNAFPSLHLTWALLIAINARRPAWKIAAVTFVALTAAATIGSGEHYFVDLAAAIPFSAGVQYLAMRVSPRIDAALEARA